MPLTVTSSQNQSPWRIFRFPCPRVDSRSIDLVHFSVQELLHVRQVLQARSSLREGLLSSTLLTFWVLATARSCGVNSWERFGSSQWSGSRWMTGECWSIISSCFQRGSFLSLWSAPQGCGPRCPLSWGWPLRMQRVWDPGWLRAGTRGPSWSAVGVEAGGDPLA